MKQYFPAPRIGFAVLLIVLGIFLLLDNYRIYDFGDLISTWWPLILIYLGVNKLAQVGTQNVTFPVILISGGLVFLLFNLDFFDWYYLEKFWPVILLLVGVWIIYDAIQRPKRQEKLKDQDSIYVNNIMSGTKVMSSSKQFKGGVVSGIMGGSEIDLTEADIQGEAILDLTYIMGGSEIRVPSDWQIDSRITPIMGGISDERKNAERNENKKLVLTGTVFMGGVEFRS